MNTGADYRRLWVALRGHLRTRRAGKRRTRDQAEAACMLLTAQCRNSDIETLSRTLDLMSTMARSEALRAHHAQKRAPR